MNLQDNIYRYRKEKGYSQEELGVLCHVSRQAVSKWENGSSKPDSDNLVLLAKYLEVTTDALLGVEKEVINEKYSDLPMYHEISYTSKFKIFNIPLVDVYFRVFHFHYYRSVMGLKVKTDTRSRCAKGIIAIGTKAVGLFTLSFFGLGLFGIGLFNIGIIASLGIFSIAGLYSFGVIALSLYFAFGVVAVGAYAFGVLAYGMQVAFGVATFGNHTIGILANGTHSYVIQDGATCIVDIEHYKQLQFLIENHNMPGFLRSILSNVPLCK